MRKLLAVTGACALLAGVPAASSAQGVPSDAVAVVDGQPVTKARYDHWFGIERRVAPRARDRQLRQRTMALLIQALWLDGEAAALGLDVTDARVRAALRKAKRESFGSEREYRRFLRQSGMTNADVLFQVRSQELAEAITKHVQRGAGKDAKRRLRAFGRAFQKRWAERTECRAGFVVKEWCGSVSSAETASAAGGYRAVRIVLRPPSLAA